ncbi:MAG: phenylalanine--tRNA ligase beta subunit-related protein [Candidatus Bathyarchaeia archaeon]|nr:hypothetical protein [Candidatus Bathyarchaeota archaeon]
MRIIVSQKIKDDFSEPNVLAIMIKGLKVKKRDQYLEYLKADVIREVKSKYTISSLKDIPSIRAYRDFFWKIGIDPTKSRPAAEALLRRLLSGGKLPNINTFVDSLNLASIISEVAIGSFDARKIAGEVITIRYANRGEEFYGIGMDKPIQLEGREIVLSDDSGLIAIYPYRDCERTKITEETQSAILIFCGVPGIRSELLHKAMNITTELIIKFCGGLTIPVEVR